MKITCPTHESHDEFSPALGIRMAVGPEGNFISADEPARTIEAWRSSPYPEFTTVFCLACGAICKVEP